MEKKLKALGQCVQLDDGEKREISDEFRHVLGIETLCSLNTATLLAHLHRTRHKVSDLVPPVYGPLRHQQWSSYRGGRGTEVFHCVEEASVSRTLGNRLHSNRSNTSPDNQHKRNEDILAALLSCCFFHMKHTAGEAFSISNIRNR